MVPESANLATVLGEVGVKKRIADLMAVGQVWQSLYQTGHAYAYYLTYRMDTYPAECYWAINLDMGKRVMLYDVRSSYVEWERIA